ncbi:hypothetical protein D3C81_1722890 [compost metagenome]
MPATFVEHARAFGRGIGDQAVEVVDLAGLWQRGQRHAWLPRHAGLERGQFALEFVEEGIDHVLVDEQDLQCRAALAVERQRAGNRFFDGVVEVHLG